MIYIIVVYLLILLFYIVQKKCWAPATFLVGVFAFSAIFSAIMLNNASDYAVDYSINLWSCVVYIIGTLLFFSPFFIKRPTIVPCNNPAFVVLFTRIGLFFGIISIICMLILLPYLEQVFALDFMDSRKYAVEGDQIVEFVARSIPAYAYRLLSSFYPLSYAFLLMFFYSYSFLKKKTFLNICLFLASFSGIIIGVFNGGRTNVIYWLLAFFALILVFYPYISKGKKITLFSMSGFFLAFILAYFFLVSNARFAENGTESELIRYTGSPFLNFSNFIQHYQADHFSLRRVFPFTSEIVGGPMSITEYREIVYSKSKMDIGLFYTMLGDLFVDLGLIGMFVYSIIYFLVSKKVIKKTEYSLSNLLIFLVLYLIPLQGLFYYSYWRSVVTLCSIATVIFSIYIKKQYHA